MDDVRTLRGWSRGRWWVALAAAAATVVVIGVPTVLIPNPWFGRSVAPTSWDWPVLVVTAVLSGLVTATYVSAPSSPETRAATREGVLGGFLAYLAVGCPACNKLALLALGSAGAVQWFAPLQPLLAAAGVALLAYALRVRLRGERSCPVPSTDGTSAPAMVVSRRPVPEGSDRA